MCGQHVKGSKNLLKYAQQYFYHIFWSLWKRISPDCLLTYWHLMTSILFQQKWVFNATNSNAIICKSKNVCSIFFSISGICKTFWILRENIGASEVICLWNYRLQKARLLNCLKSSVSEHLWTVKILKVHNTAWICTAVFLWYFLISLKEIQLEKFYISSILNLETVC